MSEKTSGRLIGYVFLLAFVLYGSGSALVDAAASEWLVSAGLLLMLFNSIGVALIGVLAVRVVSRTHEVSAHIYLATRIFEAVLLAVGAVFLVQGGSVADEASQRGYWFAMTALGLGSVFFCRALLQAQLVPRPLATWGIAGYALLAAGGMLEILGYGVGLLLSAPGGLFEVALGILLVTRGFPADQPVRRELQPEAAPR